MRGLFDGFEAFRTPTDDDHRRALAAGLVVPDTNVLLNLYRYNPRAREVLLAVFARVGDRLWVPHQVVVEFWRNRETVLRDPRNVRATSDDLTDTRDRALQILRWWARRVSLPEARSRELENAVSDGFEVALAGISQLRDDDAATYAGDTGADPVLGALEPILAGRVGEPPAASEHDAAVEEGRRRADQKRPPGYRDADKAGDGVAGDYLVWHQILGEAQRRRCDVLFVTGDLKEDWWRREHGEPRGPRPELVRELRGVAGTRLFMLRPDGLLAHAGSALDVEIADEVVEDVVRVDRFLAEGVRRPGSGWTAESVAALLLRLGSAAPVQAAVIRRAARNGGFVSREDVYDIGDYDAERSLRGFTRPVSRVVGEFRARGLVPADAADVLVTEYDPDVADFGWARGFRIPADLVVLVSQD